MLKIAAILPEIQCSHPAGAVYDELQALKPHCWMGLDASGVSLISRIANSGVIPGRCAREIFGRAEVFPGKAGSEEKIPATVSLFVLFWVYDDFASQGGKDDEPRCQFFA